MKYLEIRDRLKVPVPPEFIEMREQGGANIYYVNVDRYKELLDERAGVWTAEVGDYKQIGESLCCTVKLGIYAEDGIFVMDGTGIEPLNTNSYGDPFSNAFAQAFRRACASHGLSRELWLNPPGQNGHGRFTPQQASAYAQSPIQRNAKPQGQWGPSSRPATGNATSERDLVTAAQLTLLRRKASEAGVDADDVAVQEFSDVSSAADLSKKAASYLIDQF